MYKRGPKGWLKHIDFILLNLVALHASFCVAYTLRMESGILPYTDSKYGKVLLLLTGLQILVTITLNTYKNVLKRDAFSELKATFLQVLLVMFFVVFVLFVLKVGAQYSRLVMGAFGIIYFFMGYIVTILWKGFLKKHKNEKHSIVIITVVEALDDLRAELQTAYYNSYRVSALAVLDGDFSLSGNDLQGIGVETDDRADIEILNYSDEVLEKIKYGWVDEVYIDIPSGYELPENLLSDLADMGITINMRIRVPKELKDYTYILDKKLGHNVLTVSNNYITLGSAFVKRLIDIIGGLIGCLITVVLTVFLAPMIYIASPGPIFFSQKRIGKNGKVFKIYKFRSMYMDAEERKASLLEENRIKDGMMFKLEYDPRIIGCKKLPDGTIKKGIGNRIRDWSLDEFPQFFNVLKGDMSLVGTRPPTEDEWEKYSAHHRGRMAIKPGITGLWQVSGRSKITDFDEVVRLDRKYIDEWSIGNDIRILFKTLAVVVKGDGSM